LHSSRSLSLMWVRCFCLKCFVKSLGLANLEVRFSNGKLCSFKQKKQVVVFFFVNTNNVASLNACFSASAAVSCELVSFDGVGLAFCVDGLTHGQAAAPPL
jgi:hypothetical protein